MVVRKNTSPMPCSPGDVYGIDFGRVWRLAYRALQVWGPLTMAELRRALGITADCAAARSLSGKIGARNNHGLVKIGEKWGFDPNSRDVYFVPKELREPLSARAADCIRATARAQRVKS